MRDVPKAGKTVKGRVNRLIDDLVRPYFRDHPALIIVDGLLHAMVEDKKGEVLGGRACSTVY